MEYINDRNIQTDIRLSTYFTEIDGEVSGIDCECFIVSTSGSFIKCNGELLDLTISSYIRLVNSDVITTDGKIIMQLNII